MVAVLVPRSHYRTVRDPRDGGPKRPTYLRLVADDEARRAELAVRPPAGRSRPSPAVYRRRRAVVLGMLVAAGIGLWLIAQAIFAPGQAQPPAVTPIAAQTVSARVVTVHPGDTLWSIAASVRHSGDIRLLVDALSAEVHGRPLQVGEQLTIP